LQHGAGNFTGFSVVQGGKVKGLASFSKSNFVYISLMTHTESEAYTRAGKFPGNFTIVNYIIRNVSLYSQNNEALLPFIRKYPTDMKNKLLLIATLVIMVMTIASCASQKYGCPANPQYSSRFRG
jgi:hypothetical protein